MKTAVFVVLVAGCSATSELVATRPESAGANCAAGGLAVVEGTDDNGDGELQDAEIEATHYVCNGGSGGEALVDVQAEDPPEHCANGGSVVRVGVDLDGDGVLDADEVRQTAYVCTADPATSDLVSTRPEPVGDNCPAGGVAIVAGADIDGDGVLSETEVTSTSYVCNGAFAGTTLDGDFRIANNLDIALLANITDITGTLSVDGNAPLPWIVLPSIEHVGSLSVFTSQVKHLALPGLRTVDNSVGIVRSGASEGDTLDLPSLETVGLELHLRGGAGPVSLPALVHVGANVQIRDMDTATEISAPLLEEVGEWFAVSGLPSLVSLHVGALSTVGGLDLAFCSSLTEDDVQLPAARFPLGLHLSSIAWTSLSPLVAVTQIGELAISADEMTSIDLPNVLSIGKLTVFGDELQSFTVPSLMTVDGPVRVSAPQLSACAVNALFDAIGYTGPRNITAGPC